jgi:hypothetical protein
MYGICGPLKSEAAAVLNYREFWGITTQPEIVTLKPGRAGTLNELRHKLKDKVSQGHLNQLRFGQLCPTIVA